MTENEVFQKYVKQYWNGCFIFKVDHSRLPDVYISSKHGVTWIELKVIKSIPRDGILKPNWRPGQLSWVFEQNRTVGIDNVNLIIYYEPTRECRLYYECKEQYSLDEHYDIIGRN